MRLEYWVVLLLGIAVGSGGCGRSSSPLEEPDSRRVSPAVESPPPKTSFEKIRGPAVAGMFYPQHEEELAKEVDQLLAEADPPPLENVRGLVCPHAGYAYSGKTAAIAYKTVAAKPFRTVVVMAPSHYASFEGASLPDVEAYETPLGMIPLSPKAAELARLDPFQLDPSCDVRRPQWWRQSPKELPAFGEDTPHSWEHSIEVQLPFLQRALGGFELVPIVFGQLDPEAVAKTLQTLIDESTLVVASSDLSHYHPYETAKGLDAACVEAICALNPEWMQQQEACGKGPIITLIHLARMKGWKAKLLEYCNSGDTSGDKSQGVVGYAAIVFYEPSGVTAVEDAAPSGSSTHRFTAEQEEFLLRLARNAVKAAVQHRRLPAPPADEVDAALTGPRACFVTLTIDGQLRGCIGGIFPQEPLYQAVIRKAQSAAVADRRFPPVTSKELEQIKVEVSVLTIPRRLSFTSAEQLLDKLRPEVDGVVLRIGQRQSTYLPQVWKQIPDRVEFLDHLAEKAGLEASAWRGDGVNVLVYQAEAFSEGEISFNP